MIPNYLKDIHAYIEAIPYGDVEFVVRRVNRKTTTVETRGQETLRYNNNDEALGDINTILKNLSEASYNGRATIELEYKDGDIVLVGIHDEKATKY